MLATPAGQLLVLHMRAATQPTACIAELDTAMPSAPRASAFAKSTGTRSPPVMISVTRPLAPCSSRNRRARANAGIVGDADVVAEHLRCCAGPAPATIENDVIDAGVESEAHVGFDVVGAEFHADRNAPGDLTHAIAETAEVGGGVHVRERRWRDRRFTLGGSGGPQRSCRCSWSLEGGRRYRSWPLALL